MKSQPQIYPFISASRAIQWLKAQRGVTRRDASAAIDAAARQYDEWKPITGDPGLRIRFNQERIRWEIEVSR